MAFRTYFVVVVLAFSPGIAFAYDSATTSVRALQQATVTPPEYADSAKEFGTSDLVVTTIQAQTLGRNNAGNGLDFSGSYYFNAPAGGIFSGGVHLPTGAEILSWGLEACDDSGSSGLVAVLYSVGPTPNDSWALLSPAIITGASATPGCAWFLETLGSPTTVMNLGNTYGVEMNDSDSSTATRFRSLRVVWQRQVSPPPGTATFGDVPTGHPFFQHVEALVASGVTAGCGGGDYCPDSPLTRGQLAVFLAAALGLHWPN